MKDRNEKASGRHENQLAGEIDKSQKRKTDAAHREADKDIAADAELSAHSPNDDLDEGETARLGENTSLI